MRSSFCTHERFSFPHECPVNPQDKRDSSNFPEEKMMPPRGRAPRWRWGQFCGARIQHPAVEACPKQSPAGTRKGPALVLLPKALHTHHESQRCFPDPSSPRRVARRRRAAHQVRKTHGMDASPVPLAGGPRGPRRY